jgi:hypothetical protein
MLAHTRLIALGVATLICVSILHDAFAATRPQKLTAAPVSFPDAPQNAQRHLFTGTAFRAASIGY